MCRPKGYVSEKSISGKKGMKIQVHPEIWVHIHASDTKKENRLNKNVKYSVNCE